MRNKLLENIEEIHRSNGLSLFGAALASLHFATFIFWRNSFLDRLRLPLDYVCWPVFPDCGIVRQVPFEMWRLVFVLYGMLAIVTAFLFIRRQTGSAWTLLLALTVLKFAFQIVDYRGMGNYHFMMSLASLGFLFFKNKIVLLRGLMVLFYIGSGILKFNREWLSGALLEGSPHFLTASMLHSLAVAVIFLEMVVAWWLLAKQTHLRMLALLSFAIFHIISWNWVGFYFPTIMFGLLSIYLLTWKEEVPSGILSLKNWPSTWAPRLFLIGFIVFQIPPFFTFGDPALDAKLKLFSLSMYEARPQCEILFFLRYKDTTVEYMPFFHKTARGQCNTLMVQSEMHRICHEEGRRTDFENADAIMVSKRMTDASYRTLINARDFCGNKTK